MNKKFLLILALLVPLPLAAQPNDVLNIVTGNDYGVFSGEDLREGGMAIQTLRAALQETGTDVNLSFEQWIEGYEKTSNNEYDATLPYSINKEREKEYIFSDSIYRTVTRLFYLTSNEKVDNPSKASDLTGLTICSPLGWAPSSAIQNLFDSGQAKREMPADMTACFDLLAAGKTDLVLSPGLQGNDTVEASSKLDSFDVETASWEVAIKNLRVMFPKKAGAEAACSHLVLFNTGLATMRVNGVLNDIARSWFGRMAQLSTPNERYVLVRKGEEGPEEITGTAIGLRGRQFFLDIKDNIVGVPLTDILWFSRLNDVESKEFCLQIDEAETVKEAVADSGGEVEEAVEEVVDEAPRTLKIAGPIDLTNNLAPALLSSWLEREVVKDDDDSNLYVVSNSDNSTRLPEQLYVVGEGDGDAFDRLAKGEADLAITRRQPDARERARLTAEGDFPLDQAEHVIALEAMVVVTNRSRQIEQLSAKDVYSIIEGKIFDWSSLGTEPAPLTLLVEKNLSYSIEDGSFGGKPLFVARGVSLVDSHAEALSSVETDPNMIALVPLSTIEQADVNSVVLNECGLQYEPREFTTRTEEYPLTKRLYMFYSPGTQTELVAPFVRFAEVGGEEAIASEKLTALTIGRQGRDDYVEAFENINRNPEQNAMIMAGVRERTLGARRLSATFRFLPGSARLDARSVRDIERLAEYLDEESLAATDISLIGYADSRGAYERNCALSIARAHRVETALAQEGVQGKIDIYGACEEAPVACNDVAEGQSLNRRVEVWLR